MNKRAAHSINAVVPCYEGVEGCVFYCTITQFFKTEKTMKYWPTDRDKKYVREDGRTCNSSEIFNNDIAPQIIYDEDIQMPNAVYRTLEKMMVGSSR